MAPSRRTLTLVLLGLMLVFSAAASSAQALPVFKSEKYAAKVTGTQKISHEFFVSPNTVVCTTATYTGWLTEESSTLSVSPKFEGCTVTKGLNKYDATVEALGCEFVFHLSKKIPNRQEWESDTDFVCPSQEMEITIFNGLKVEHNVKNLKCTIKIPQQEPKFWRGTWRPELIVEKTPFQKVKVTGEEAFCGKATNGTYAGVSTFSATDEEGNPNTFSVSGE